MNKLSVTFDCIIFGLQRFGGISNYWARIVDGMRSESQLNAKFLLPSAIKYQEFNSTLRDQQISQIELLPPSITRFLPASIGNWNEKIFHTSYYRFPLKPVENYVVTVYDFTYERYRKGLPLLVHTKQKLASIRSADTVICISQATKNDVIEFCPGIDESKLHVIPLGVDRELYYPDPIDLRLSNINRITLFVGQRSGYKRFDLAVEAIEACPKLILGIVGPSLSSDEKSMLVKKLGSRWHEFGPVSSVVLRNLYSSAYAFIFPSDYEGFGLPILEAMACGCPVVAAQLSSFPEVGGNAALYAKDQTGVEYARILKELNDDDFRKESIFRNMIHVGSYSWGQTIAKTRNLYLT